MWGLSHTWRERLLSYQRLVVGFSGGLDSTVLLHLLASEPLLLGKLQAVHVHHGLSPHADIWQVHCQAVCATYAVPYVTESVLLNTASNIEEAAREARYAVFKRFIGPQDCLLLAHHLDDQAETVLFNLLRGTGVDGLAAMPEMRSFAAGDLARPLLHLERVVLEAYATENQLSFIEDESNQDRRFTRNYLRHDIMPRLKARFPQVLQSIHDCAHHAKDATHSLQALAYLDCPELAFKRARLSLKPLYTLSRVRLIQVLRVWLKQEAIQALSAKHFDLLLDEVIFARHDAMPCFRIGEVCIRRYRDVLYLASHHEESEILPVTREMLLSKGIGLPEGQMFSVRKRHGGESMVWRGHTRTLKKIFQSLDVPPWLRDTIPLIFVDDTLVAILDFAVADAYSIKEESDEVV